VQLADVGSAGEEMVVIVQPAHAGEGWSHGRVLGRIYTFMLVSHVSNVICTLMYSIETLYLGGCLPLWGAIDDFHDFFTLIERVFGK